MLTTLSIANYRSLRKLVVPLRRLNVISGPNGSGKSSIYRALRLLAETALGGVIPSLAREGGLQSTLWAGPESFARSVQRGEHPVQGTVRKELVSLRLGFAGEEFGYAIDLGLPASSSTAFSLDPEIKRECVWVGQLFRLSSLLVDRRGPAVRIKDDQGEWHQLAHSLDSFDSMLAQLADPRSAPELLRLREMVRSWRFYDHFRSDMQAPARLPQVGTHTPVLANDGADLAAAVQTIIEIGDREAMDKSVADAFPGARLEVTHDGGRFEIAMTQHGLLRPLRAAEVSDGTLRYLLWIAALLTPRPPELLVLNEPETSLYSDLLAPLARLIARAAQRSQVLVVSHAAPLIGALEEQPDCHSVVLEKVLSETKVVGQTGPLNTPVWHWPTR